MGEDYVPGATDPDFDYTKDDRTQSGGVPFNDAAEIGDDVEISTDFRPDTSAEEIEKGSFRSVPVGVHVLYVKEVKWADITAAGNGVHKKVYVKQPDGRTRAMSLDTRQIMVNFAMPGDENCTCRDFFLLPPSSKDQMEAYEYGFSEEADAVKNPRQKGGFHAKKLMHFLARLGFQNDANGKIPKEAGKLANWVRYPRTNIHRFIKLEIEPPNAKKSKYQDRDGNWVEKKQYPQIKMFSFCFVPPPPEVAAAQRQNQQPSSPVAPAAYPVTKPEIHEPESEPNQEKLAEEANREAKAKNRRKPAASHA